MNSQIKVILKNKLDVNLFDSDFNGLLLDRIRRLKEQIDNKK